MFDQGKPIVCGFTENCAPMTALCDNTAFVYYHWAYTVAIKRAYVSSFSKPSEHRRNGGRISAMR